MLSLDETGKVSIGNDQPEVSGKPPGLKLDVNGVVRSSARIGTALKDKAGRPSVEADAIYHDITEELEGVQALEIVAKVSDPRRERHAILHAIALNASNPVRGILNWWNRFNRIKVHQSFYSAPKDRMQLRWLSTEGKKYKLQLKTSFDYGSDIRIQYHVTRLWVDHNDSEGAFPGSRSADVTGADRDE